MIVGLGNPGKEYVDTRHNIGFQVIDSLAETLQSDVKQRKFGARIGFGEFAEQKIILLKPWQYMNRSGQAVATVKGFYKLDVSDLLVVLDDMALEPGRIRIRENQYPKPSAVAGKAVLFVKERGPGEYFAYMRR